MLTQVNAKQGLLKYRKKGSQTISSNYDNYTTQVLLPIRKKDMTYQNGKTHSSTLCT